MQENWNAAINKAEEYMAAHGYKHGPCIGVECQTQSIWEVEFARPGYESRSDTADPPSIVLIVNLDQDSIRPANLM